MSKYRRDYRCHGCRAEGVKLWREYQTIADATKLLCADCAVADQKKDAFDFDDGDQIGWLVPAVPTEDGSTFWGYTSVPHEDVMWWHALPTYRDAEREVACLRNLLARSMTSAHYSAVRWLEVEGQLNALRRKEAR